MARMSFQRIFILTVVAVFLVGTLGAYLLIVFTGNDGTATVQQQEETSQEEEELPVDKDAYIVKEPVTALQIQDITQGTGAAAKATDTVKVQYKGTLAATGQLFDQTSGQPIEIPLDAVITGWREGIPGMKVGGTRRLVIPADKAYGASGTGSIPPNSALVFEVTLDGITQSQ